jgi:hypothetical protein
VIIWINEAKVEPEVPRKQTNGKFNNIVSAHENEWENIAAVSSTFQKLKSRVCPSSSQSLIFSSVASVSPAALNIV